MSFTILGYKRMLEIALKNGYKFAFFHQKDIFLSDEKICFLRHDIDVSVELAYEMALIESELGIKSTYFFMLRSPVYNLFSRHNHIFVEKIIELGHEIALHYDEGFYPKHNKELNKLVKYEVITLENIFNIKIQTVSFHQPSEDIIQNKIELIDYINTYSKKDLQGFHYISDSNKVWKEYHPQIIFEQSLYPKLHLLIHPIWWITEQDLSTEILWQKSIKKNLTLSEKQILETERAYGNLSHFKT